MAELETEAQRQPKSDDGVPLSILIVDADDRTAAALEQELVRRGETASRSTNGALIEAQAELRAGDYNTIFIDPLSFDVDAAADFVFAVRGALPEIVFVLYVDASEVEARRTDFYAGNRRRFVHYYSLDKQTPVGRFRDEVDAVLRLCRQDLSWRMSAESLRRARSLVSSRGDISAAAVATELDRALSLTSRTRRDPQRKVFLSHRFAETEYVDGLTQLLEREGFEVTIGAPANTYVSQAILQRIEEADFFVCLMTRYQRKEGDTFTTSAWLLEEKGAALALRKPIVLLIEDGVDDFGGLQGDWQRIHFGAKGFLGAALKAVQQLKSYAGSS